MTSLGLICPSPFPENCTLNTACNRGFMSALPSAATCRPFIFDDWKVSQSFLDRLSKFPKLSGVTPASRLEVRPTPEMVTSGIREIDALTGGLPRGCLTEISGPASSGRTSLLLAALAAATHRGEVCALVDAGDALDPLSAAAAGIDLEKLLWVRCVEKKNHSAKRHRDTEKGLSILDQVLRVTDLLLQSNGFGLIALDLGDISTRAARRIPLVSWFRFRRAIETTSTVLLVLEQQPIAGSCSSLLLRLQASGARLQQDRLSTVGSQLSENHLIAVSCQPSTVSSSPSHCRLLESMRFTVQLEYTRLEHKPPHSQTIVRTQPVWAAS